MILLDINGISNGLLNAIAILIEKTVLFNT